MRGSYDDFGDTPQPAASAPHQKVDLGSVDDALSAGVPGAKFEAVGTVVKGVIVSAEMAQQRDLATGKPKFWEDGNPCTQILITLATEDRSADIDDDDGHRRLYVKRPSAMLKAIAGAMGKLKLSQAIGGTLAVKYTGDGEAAQRGFNKPKLYAAKFTPAAPTQVHQTANPSQAGPMSTAIAQGRIDAFKVFKEANPNLTGELLKAAWLALLGRVCPNLAQAAIDESGWAKVKQAAAGYDPAFDAPAPEDQDIPF